MAKKLRRRAVTWDELNKIISDMFSKLGKRGGHVRAKRLTPAQRSAIARKAARARWAKKK
jgi:hypothetical protein